MNPKFASLSLYRRTAVLGVMFAVASQLLSLPVSLMIQEGMQPAAAQESTDWPDEIDYPPQAYPVGSAQNPGPPKKAPKISGEKTSLKQKLWPFGKSKADKAPPPTEEQIVNVGPKEPPPSSNPLLRLSVPFHGDTGIIPTGFYLVGVREVSSEIRELTLMKQNRPVVSLTVKRSPVEAEQSPVGPIKEPPKPPMRLETKLSGDQKSLRVILTEGDVRFESAPLPTAVDTRRQLTF